MALMVTVHFVGVGRSKDTWSVTLPLPLTHHALYREVKKKRALMSEDIQFTDDGGIYVGLVRRVGSWMTE
jgi:hypothetical protein